jgi:hypothetical protein
MYLLELNGEHSNNSFKVARKKRGLDAAQMARSAT